MPKNIPNNQNLSEKNPTTVCDDRIIMNKIRKIISKGNDAEIKGNRDGTLCVLEIKKTRIV